MHKLPRMKFQAAEGAVPIIITPKRGRSPQARIYLAEARGNRSRFDRCFPLSNVWLRRRAGTKGGLCSYARDPSSEIARVIPQMYEQGLADTFH